MTDCNEELVEWLERMTPFGLDNPVGLSQNAQIESVSTVGAGKHVRFTVRDGSHSVEAIGFGMGEPGRAARCAALADLAFVPTLNTWNGQQRVQLKLKGVRFP